MSQSALADIGESLAALHCIPSNLSDDELTRVVWAAMSAGIDVETIIDWASPKKPAKIREKAKRHKPGVISAGTLFFIANTYGYVRSSNSRTAIKPKPVVKPVVDNTQKNDKAKANAELVIKAAAPATSETPYLKQKALDPVDGLYQISAEEFKSVVGYPPKSHKNDKTLTGNLLIAPVRELNGNLTSIEIIDGTGSKSALYGGKKKECAFHTTGIKPDTTHCIAEGVATSTSCYLAAPNETHLAGLSNTGLKGTIGAIRRNDKDVSIIACADAKNGYPDQPTAIASVKHGAKMAMPWLPPSVHKKPDFDDVRSLYGTGAVGCMLKQAQQPGYSPSFTDKKGNTYISGLSSVLIDKKYQPIFKAMSDHIDKTIIDPVTGIDNAKIQPSGLWLWRIKRTARALLLCDDKSVEAINNLAEIRNTKKKIKTAENGNVYDAQAFISWVQYRIGSDVRIVATSNQFIVQQSGGWSCDLTNAIGDYLPMFLYWVECLELIRHRVGTEHKTFSPDRYGNSYNLGRLQSGFPEYEINGTHLNDTLNSPFIVSKMPQKSGKTSVMGKAFMSCSPEETAMALCHRVKLVDDLANVFGSSHYKDDREIIARGGAQSVSACINSLPNKALIKHFANSNKIFIDEAEQVKRHILGTGLGGRQREVFNALKKHLSGKEIMLADADLSDECIDFWRSLSGHELEDIAAITVDEYDHGFNTDYFCHSARNKHGAKAVDKAIKLLQQNKRVAIACESKNQVQRIEKKLKQHFRKVKKILAITADTKKGYRDALGNNASDFTDQFDCVIYNGAMGTGVSIEHATNKFEHVLFVGSGTVLTADDAIQMIRRFRDAKYFMFDVLVSPERLSHRHWDFDNEIDDPLDQAKARHVFTESIEHAHFASNLKAKLKDRLFNINYLNEFAEIELADIDKAPAIAAMCAARDISDKEAMRGHNNNKELAEIKRYQCKEVYGTVTPETAERFLNPLQLSTDRRLSKAAKSAPVSSERGLLDLLLSKKLIKRPDAKAILEYVRENLPALIIANCLPERWARTGCVPKGEKPMRAINELLKIFGIKADIEGDRHNSKLCIQQQKYQFRMIQYQELDIVWPVSIESQIISMKEQGLSNREVARLLGVSEFKVRSAIKTTLSG